ncbi:MAG: GTPase Era [Mycoplasmoidaceae bacterium]
MENLKKIYQGYVAIVGKPNVGKSTFINTFLKRKLAITSHKPQTTRNQIKGIYQDEDSYIILIDTPGFHNPRNKLDMFLNSEVKKSLKIADSALFLLDPTRDIDEEDENIIKQLNSWKIKKIIFVITKMDIANLEQIENVKNYINNYFKNPEFHIISNIENKNIDSLIPKIKNQLEKYEGLILPSEEELELSDSFIVKEVLREVVIKSFRQELPYSTAIFINKIQYNDVKKLLSIQADIIVEKEAQKPIIIGNNGKKIKEIGTNARIELLEIFDCKIYLELYVKVKKDWRNNNNYIIDLGYKK